MMVAPCPGAPVQNIFDLLSKLMNTIEVSFFAESDSLLELRGYPRTSSVGSCAPYNEYSNVLRESALPARNQTSPAVLKVQCLPAMVWLRMSKSQCQHVVKHKKTVRCHDYQ